MTGDVIDRPVPDPGSPAAWRQILLDGARARGQFAACARTFDFDSRRTPAFAFGEDVVVEVKYEYEGTGRSTSDQYRLDTVWTLVDSGATLIRLSCPDDPLPHHFMAVALYRDHAGTTHDLMVIDRRRGQAEALASTTMVEGKKVGAVMRHQILRYAQSQERKRMGVMSTKLNRQSPGNPVGPLLFASGATEHLMKDPIKRGIDPGRPALQWFYVTADLDGTERVVSVSDPDFRADPLSRTATAGISTLTMDETGRSDPYSLGSNRQLAPLDSSGEFEQLARPPQKAPIRPEIETTVSEVKVSRIEPRRARIDHAECASCGQVGVVNDDGVCRRCWKSDLAARERLLGAVAKPEPTFDPVRRRPDDHEMKPHPDDPRQWIDPTSNEAIVRAEHLADLRETMGDQWSDDMESWFTDDEMARLIENSGVDDDGSYALWLFLTGYAQGEIASMTGQSQPTVSRILQRAGDGWRKKLAESE